MKGKGCTGSSQLRKPVAEIGRGFCPWRISLSRQPQTRLDRPCALRVSGLYQGLDAWHTISRSPHACTSSRGQPDVFCSRFWLAGEPTDSQGRLATSDKRLQKRTCRRESLMKQMEDGADGAEDSVRRWKLPPFPRSATLPGQATWMGGLRGTEQRRRGVCDAVLCNRTDPII